MAENICSNIGRIQNDDPLLTPIEAGRYLGFLSRPAAAAHRLARLGRVAYVELGPKCRRFRKSDLDAMIAARLVTSPKEE